MKFDPTLTSRDYGVPVNEIEHQQQVLADKMAQLQYLKTQAMQQQQPQQSRNPVWDEIDSVMQGMSDKEFELVTASDEWIESNNQIMQLIQSAQLQMLKPIIEGTKEGKDILESHLTITKRLKKSASKEVDNELNDFKEYKEKYSDMPYAEYLKMKREPKTKKK